MQDDLHALYRDHLRERDRSQPLDPSLVKEYKEMYQAMGEFMAEHHIVLLKRIEKIQQQPDIEKTNGKGEVPQWKSFWVVDPQTEHYLERIAKAGRKYAVGLCVVSQRPHELSETVLAQCSTFICLRITNPDDQEYVRALVPDAARGILEALTSLAQGEAIATGEAVPTPVRFRVTMPDPPPNAQSIEYAGMWTKGPQDVDVEHIVDCWRRQRR